MKRNLLLFTMATALMTARSAPADELETGALTPDTLVALALEDNPQIQSMKAKWEAALEYAAQADSLPDPMFTYGGMDRSNGGRFPDTEQKRFTLEQSFPWFGKLGLRRRAADEEAEAMRQDYEASVLDTVRMVKEAYYNLYSVQRSLEITREEKDILGQLESVAEARYASGAVGQQDVLKAQAEISMLDAKLLDLEAQENFAKAQISALLNRPAGAPLGPASTPPPAIAVPDLQALVEQADNARPEIRREQSLIEKSRHEKKLMAKEFLPDYRLGVEYRDMGTEPDMAMFMVAIDLPIHRGRVRRGVQAMDKRIEAGHAAEDAARQQAGLEVQDAHFRLGTALRTVEVYRAALVPQAESRFAASDAAYRAGSGDFLDLLESERFLLNARLMLAMAEGDLGMWMARLERAVGTELNPHLKTGGPQP